MSAVQPLMDRRDLLKGLALACAASAVDPGLASAATASSAQSYSGDRFRAYRRILASERDEDVCCWYLGTMFLRPDGLPEIPVIQAQTIMAYRARSIAAERFTVAWTEIGCFRDPVRGGPATSWLNPLTGKTLAVQSSFKDGPGQYSVQTAAAGIGVTLQQTGAIIQGVDVSLTERGSTVMLQQTEHKIRGGGTSASAAELALLPRSTTILTLWADRSQIDDPNRASVEASGAYSFETAALPPWAGLAGYTGSTVVRGIMRKARVDEILDPDVWQRLRGLYPEFFSGDRVAPTWLRSTG